MKTVRRAVEEIRKTSSIIHMKDIHINFDNGITKKYSEEFDNELVKKIEVECGIAILTLWRTDSDINNVHPYDPEYYKWKGKK